MLNIFSNKLWSSITWMSGYLLYLQNVQEVLKEDWTLHRGLGHDIDLKSVIYQWWWHWLDVTFHLVSILELQMISVREEFMKSTEISGRGQVCKSKKSVAEQVLETCQWSKLSQMGETWRNIAWLCASWHVGHPCLRMIWRFPSMWTPYNGRFVSWKIPI